MGNSSAAGAGNAGERTVLVTLRGILDLAVFCGLLLVVVLTPVPYGSSEVWWTAVFECGVFALAAVWFLRLALGGPAKVSGWPVLVPLLVMTAYIFIQIVPFGTVSSNSGGIARTMPRTLSIDPYQTYLTGMKALALTAFLGLLLMHTNTPQRLRWLIRMTVGIGVVSALFGIVRQFLQSESSPRGFGLAYLFGGVGYAQFISANTFAYLMEMCLGLVAGLVLGGAVRRNRILVHLTVALVLGAALVFSNSRGAILGLGCQVVFLAYMALSWYSARRNASDGGSPNWLNLVGRSVFVRLAVVIAILAIVLGGIVWMGGNRLASKQSYTEEAEGATRSEIWRATLQVIKQRPITGVGFGSYFLAVPQYQTGGGKLRIQQAHNDYLDLIANGGVIALIIAACFVAVLIMRIRHPLRSTDPFRRAAALGATAGLLAIAVHSVLDFGLQVTGIAVVLIVLIVIAVADARVESAAPGRAKIISAPEA